MADFKLTFDNGTVAYTDVEGCETAQEAGELLVSQAIDNKGWVTIGGCFFHRTHLIVIEEHDLDLDEEAA